MINKFKRPKITAALALLCCLFTQQASADFAKGADISWLSEQKAYGAIFKNDSGNEQDVLQILKDHDMDSVRLRVWVNPADGYYSSIDDVIIKAQQAKAAGMRIMIDFHYSDSWADPGQQTKPAQWSSYDTSGLMSAVWWHTYDSLTALKNAGITPEWVQVGNETNNGMLWEEGKASVSMQNYTWLTNSGYDATKEVFPNAKVIVHLANCHDNANFRWIFDGLAANGGKWDVIGASSYPTNASGINWQTANEQCLTNLNDMVARYDTDVMITEVGVPWDHTEAKTIVADVISKAKAVNGNRGLGVFYWEPQSSNWNGYTLGAWNPNTNQPTAALDAFIDNSSSNGSVNGTYRIMPVHSGKAIDVNYCSANNGTNIQQWTWLNNDCQKWNISQVDGEWHRISPVSAPNKAFEIDSFSTSNGGNIMLWDYWGGTNQQFRFESAGSGKWRMINRNSGLCVDITGISVADGANLNQWQCISGNNNQVFELISQ